MSSVVPRAVDDEGLLEGVDGDGAGCVADGVEGDLEAGFVGSNGDGEELGDGPDGLGA